MDIRNNGRFTLGRRRGVRLEVDGLGGGGIDAYSARAGAIANANLIDWSKMGEASGTVAVDSSPVASNGVYSNVTLGQPGVSGRTAALFNGTTSLNNRFTAARAAAFNGAEGSVNILATVDDWADGVIRYFFALTTDGNNAVRMFKNTTTGLVTAQYVAGATTKTIQLSSNSDTGFVSWHLTWSAVGDYFRAYKNGVLTGTPQSALGIYAGALTVATAGAASAVPAQVHSGKLQHFMLWNTPLTLAQIQTLANLS